jgi:hypothetical protein
VEDAWPKSSKEFDDERGVRRIRARELASGNLTQVLMSVRPLIPGECASVSLAHALLHDPGIAPGSS